MAQRPLINCGGDEERDQVETIKFKWGISHYFVPGFSAMGPLLQRQTLKVSWHILQTFSKKHAMSSRFFKHENNTTSDWLNRIKLPIQRNSNFCSAMTFLIFSQTIRGFYVSSVQVF